MKSYVVKEMMIPLEEYATVSEDANLLEAVMALDRARTEFSQTGYRHRAILVLDKNGDIVGKVSQHDLLIALEHNYKELLATENGALSRFGLSNMFAKFAMKEYNLWDKPLDHLCKKAIQINTSIRVGARRKSATRANRMVMPVKGRTAPGDSGRRSSR